MGLITVYRRTCCFVVSLGSGGEWKGLQTWGENRNKFTSRNGARVLTLTLQQWPGHERALGLGCWGWCARTDISLDTAWLCLWNLIFHQGAGIWPEQREETEMLSSKQTSFPPGGQGSCPGRRWIILSPAAMHLLPGQPPAPLNSPYEHR